MRPLQLRRLGDSTFGLDAHNDKRIGGLETLSNVPPASNGKCEVLFENTVRIPVKVQPSSKLMRENVDSQDAISRMDGLGLDVEVLLGCTTVDLRPPSRPSSPRSGALPPGISRSVEVIRLDALYASRAQSLHLLQTLNRFPDPLPKWPFRAPWGPIWTADF